MSEKNTIQLFAPTDCYVDEIKELNDGVFSEGILGMGVYLEPKGDKFYGPISGKCVQIFHTKHALHFEDSNGNVVLMHIGLDSVNLNGEPFDVKIKIGKIIDSKTEIVDVDFSVFEKNNITKSTPLLIEKNENFDYKIVKFKAGNYKKGDLIFEVEKIKKQVSLNKKWVQKDDKGNPLPIMFQDKWEIMSAQILKSVGKRENILNINNCNTRLRLNLKSVEGLQLDEVKNNDHVKGVVLKGNELQVIIGPDVYKLKDVFKEFIDRKDFDPKAKIQTESFKSKLIKIVNSVLVPVVPVICAASLITLLKSILEVTGAIQPVSLNYSSGALSVLSDYDIFTGLVYILGQTAWAFVGIYFSYSTVKFLKGDQIMGILIGITLVCPFLFSGLKWELFTIGNWTFSVTAYTSSILPHIFVGVVYVYFDRWCRKWIPVTVDLIFRHSLSYVVSILSVLLVAGPFLVLLENTLYLVIIDGLAKIPFGIGVAIFGFLWQPLVVTGMHAAFYIPMDNMIGLGIPSSLALIKQVTPLAQFGACIAVMIITKNSSTRQVTLSAAPTALFGITEPAIYGVNLIKVTPFLAACIGSAITGFFYGITNTQLHAIGNGILAVIGTLNGGTLNVVNCLVGFAIAISSSFILTVFLYRERVDEQKGIVKIYKNLEKTFKRKQNLELAIADDLKKINTVYSKEAKSIIKNLECLIYKKGLLKNKLDSLRIKSELKQQNYSKLAIKAYQKEQNEKVVKYNNLLQNVKFDSELYDEKLSSYTKQILNLNASYNEICLQAKEITNKTIDNLISITKDQELQLIKNNFNQIIMSLENNFLNIPKIKEELFSFKNYDKKLKTQLAV